jgi:threonine dehydratase
MIADPLRDQPGLDDVRLAAGRLDGVAVRTPLLVSRDLSDAIGAEVYLKCENLQHTGSFKIRGAWNRASMIPEAQRAAGLAAYSSGNHAQGVAEAARLMAIPAYIVMPSDAPSAKIDAVRRRGGEVHLYDRLRESREAIAGEMAARTGATLIRPFDDAWVIAGQGTAALEAIEQAGRVRFDSLLCCASGGGLMAGMATVFSALSPQTQLFVCEPEGHDDHVRSLEAGKICVNAPGTRSIADALMAPQPGDLTFAINQPRLSGGFTVSDDALRNAMSFAFHRLRLVLEPGGATALAALLENRERFAGGGPVLAILSGGNVDPDMFFDAVRRPPQDAGVSWVAPARDRP